MYMKKVLQIGLGKLLLNIFYGLSVRGKEESGQWALTNKIYKILLSKST